MFDKQSGPVDTRQRIFSESAPFVIKNDTDLNLQITYGAFYEVSRLLIHSSVYFEAKASVPGASNKLGE